jgi:hypothetical protein
VRTRGGINVEHARGAFYSVIGQVPLKRVRLQCRTLLALRAARQAPTAARAQAARSNSSAAFQPEPID